MNLVQRTVTPWSPTQLILFRFFVIYIAMFSLSHLFVAPFAEEQIRTLWEKPWDRFVPWVGLRIFGIEEMTIRPAGSGDTTYNYVQVFSMLIIAVVGCLVWSLLDRNRRHYDRFAYACMVYLRYYVGLVMFSYGMAKVIKTQFPFPFPDGLLQSYGDSSPMRLLWTFMGYSTSYNIFTGLGEIAGGVLLFFRRTRALGALIVVGVMSNVAMLNFSYDVPVKIFSVHLVLFAMLILVPDARRLVKVFLLNQATEPADLSTPVPSGWPTYLRLVFKVGIIGFAMITTTMQVLEYRELLAGFRNFPLRGIYDVERFSVNGDTLAPASADALRWRHLVVSYAGGATIHAMDGGRNYVAFTPDTAAQVITMYTPRDTTNKASISYTEPDSSRLVLTGVWNRDTLAVDLRRRDENTFLLVSRGFHWINEFPFNR